jgi:hypothetical protein
LRLPELYAANGLENVALDIFATDRVMRRRREHTINFISSGGMLMLGKLTTEGKMSQERANELMRQCMKEIGSGGVYLHSELYFVVGRKLEK